MRLHGQLRRTCLHVAVPRRTWYTRENVAAVMRTAGLLDEASRTGGSPSSATAVTVCAAGEPSYPLSSSTTAVQHHGKACGAIMLEAS